MNFLQKQLEDPKRFSRIKKGFYFGLVLVVLAEILLPVIAGGSHPHFSFEAWPAWGSLYGLASCVVIILVSKFLGKIWLMRQEDYYDD